MTFLRPKTIANSGRRSREMFVLLVLWDSEVLHNCPLGELFLVCAELLHDSFLKFFP